MTSIILGKVRECVEDIYYFGSEINKTRETCNVFTSIKRSEMSSIRDEEISINLWYDRLIGSWHDRMKLEHDHYEFLKAFLIHKIGEVRYFHKDQDLTSRKFVIFSTDCIASIQFLHRPGIKQNILNVFIRSSDSINLLPADLLYSWHILDSILKRFSLQENLNDEINYFITSCHYYNKDEDKVREILGVKE